MHIAIVEDNPAVLSMIETALLLHGHSVQTYTDSSSFLSALHKAQRIPPYDLLLLDLFLDKRPGTDVLEALRAPAPLHTLSQAPFPTQSPPQPPQAIPTILITAAEESTLAPIRKRYPHVPILQKPFKMQELLSLITRVTASLEA